MTCKAVFLLIGLGVPVAVSAQQNAPVGESGGQPETRDSRDSGWRFVWKDHPTLHFADLVRLEFRARLAADLRGSEIPLDPGSSDSDIARRRVGIEGRVSDLVDFQIEREITGEDPWRDVFANVRRFRALELQAGKFKVPFSLDELTSAANLDFVYRSRIATELAPGRDSGAMLHGQLFSRRLTYEAGLFAHDGDNARSRKHPDRVSGDLTRAVRLRTQPFRASSSPWKQLYIGAAMTVSRVPDGIMAVHGQTSLDQSFFPADFWVNGRRQRTGAEISWSGGPATIASEYIRFSNQRRGEGIRGEDLPTFIASGWYVSGTWTFVQARPGELARRELLPHRINLLEGAARIERIGFGNTDASGSASVSPRADSVLRNTDTILTLGINWYVTKWFSLRANLIHDSIRQADLAPAPSRPS